MSDFVRQHQTTCNFKGNESWVILSPIEQSIKNKIESVGTPLKDWDINIYRGVLTGCNEAFIISTEKRNEILNNCTTEEERRRTEELIRPILRGRDIKRYGYNWANLWLINTHNGVKGKYPPIDINDYPAIKQHLDLYWDKISKRDDKGVTPYNLRNCAYLEDFNKPKICYSEIVQSPQFYFDECEHFMPEATTFIMTGKHLKYLCSLFNSKTISYFFKTFYAGGGLGESGYRYKKAFFVHLPIPKYESSDLQKIIEVGTEIDTKVYELYGLIEEEIHFIESQQNQ